MQIDAAQILDNSTLETDICIVGAGPAGLTLASKIMDGHTRVHVLEAGAEQAIDSVDALRLDPSATALEPASDSRWRQLSGTAAIWNVRLQNRPAGRYVPLAQMDFEKRDAVPQSGWPFSRADLEPYYRAAEQLAVYGESTAPPKGPGPEIFALDPEVASTTLEAFGFATIFTQDLPRLLLQRPDVTLVTRAVVSEIKIAADTNRAEELRVVSGRSSFHVRFRVLVLAAGCIENARLLLLSRSSNAEGLGNEYGLVGRFFMDHPRVRVGYLKPFDRRVFERASAYDIRRWNGRYLGGKLTLSEALLRSGGLLNGSFQLLPHPSPRDAMALDSLKLLTVKLRSRRFDREVARWALAVLPGSSYLLTTGAPLSIMQRRTVPVISDGGWSILPMNRRRFEHFEVVLQSEQSPNPNNRVTLGDATDEYGLPRPRVSSRWTDLDIRSIRESTRILASELERARVGRFFPAEERAEPQLYQPGGAHHHMGTTRMHVDRRKGVVDENLRLHGIDNLYVAGSSVFPTGGYANPTLTILALTLRLADYLKRKLVL